MVIALVAGDYFVFEQLLPSDEGHLVMLAVGLAGVFSFSVIIFARLSDLHTRLARQNARLVQVTHDLQRRQDQLRLLSAAGTALSSDIVTGSVLQKVVEFARDVAEARRAALVTLDADGDIATFQSAGLADADRGKLVVEDLVADPSALGWLGVPIQYQDRVLGRVFVADKVGAERFSAEDEDALATLASKAAIAMENARLYDQAQRVATLEERHRIGMDLHDGAIQSLYAVSLFIEDAVDRFAGEPREAREELARAVDRLNATIADLRGYVLGLKPASMRERPLHDSLADLAAQARSSALLDLTIDVRADAEHALDEKVAESIFYIAADAVTNITRHARARHAQLRLVREGPAVVLTVTDDGVGFEAGASGEGRGHGLANMAERARALGGRFTLDSTPGGGTRVQVDLPTGTLSAR